MTEVERSGPDDGDRRPNHVAVLALALALLALLAYRNSFFAPFVFDDYDVIVNNPSLESIWPNQAIDSRIGAKRVLGHVSLALNRRIRWGGTLGFHLVNVSIHVLGAWCLLGLARRTLLLPRFQGRYQNVAAWLAFAAALLWMLHPMQTMAVSYIVQRLESQMVLFFLLAMYALVRGFESRAAWFWNSVAAISVWAGMATKENMVAAPVVMLLYDRTFFGETWGELARKRGFVYAIAIGAMAWVLWAPVAEVVQSTVATHDEAAGVENRVAAPAGMKMKDLGPRTYLYSQARVIPHYLRLAVWPDRLCFDYRGMFLTTSLADAWLPGLLVIGLLAASLVFWMRGNSWAFLGVAFFVILAPTSSFYPIVDLANEYRMYAALAPLCMLAVLGVYQASAFWFRDAKSRQTFLAGVLLLSGVGLFLRTNERNLDYRDPIRLWQSACAVNTGSFRLRFLLGTEYLQRGAAQVRAKDETAKLDLLKQAEASFDASRECTNLPANLSRVEAAVAYIHLLRGEYELARQHADLAIKHNPRNQTALKDSGALYYLQGDLRKARDEFSKAISVRISTPGALASLARTHFDLGDVKSAMDTLALADQQDPSKDEVYLQRAWVLATCGDDAIRNPKEALRIAEGIFARAGKAYYLAGDVLAAAQAANGRYAEAEKTLAEAIELARPLRLPNAGQMDARLRQYKNGEPFRGSETSASKAESKRSE